MEYLTPLPCYCDIQFSSREFLTVVNDPNHPFSKNLQIIINEILKDDKQVKNTIIKNIYYLILN